MSSFVITCGSTADLPRSFFERRGAHYICYHYTIDEKEYADDLGQTLSSDAFYKMIEGGAMPITSQVNAGQFLEFFESFLKQGLDVLHVGFSSGLSGSYQSALMVREELMQRYPERTVLVVDTLAASSGYGLLVDAACDLRDAGMDIRKIYEWLMANRLNAQHWFFSSDLTHYRRGGRISASSAVIGSLLNICPLMRVDRYGKLVQFSKLRGKRNAIRGMLEKMLEHAKDGADYSGKCFISQSACLEDAQQLKALIAAAFPKLQGEVQIYDIGGVVGAHTGPGTVALFFFGDARVD